MIQKNAEILSNKNNKKTIKKKQLRSKQKQFGALKIDSTFGMLPIQIVFSHF